MIEDRDHFEAYYGDKLWNLLPAVYRSLDTDQFTTFGPLREMVNRIGVQAAILRRSIDRLWEDQSIETCDDWVIAYIADLLATRLAPNLDASRQRLDVAKTIYYRRRKGTVAVLEEIAANITGWDAKVVEFFRRLGRTRHGLDPAIGQPQSSDDPLIQLQLAEGLAGSLTGTFIGGTARLTNIYGATKARSAFDEFFHTADFRPGIGQVGWHDIPRLGVFLWRLRSFLVGPATPVPVKDCDSWFTFDPTGRDIPLFAISSRSPQYYTSQWISPVEAQLPTPISQPLFDTQGPPYPLYPNSLAAFRTPTPQSPSDTYDVSNLKVRPLQGRVQLLESPPGSLWLKYALGFSSTTGAGPYDRRAVRAQTTAADVPGPSCSGGGSALAAPNTIPSAGTFSITDSLTYVGANDINVNGSLIVQSQNETRPLLRFQSNTGAWTEWIISGQDNSCLTLDGLFVSGTDIVLRGSFDTVIVTCCTFDPGSAAADALDLPSSGSPLPQVFALAADGQELVPSRLWIEGSIKSLNIQRCILGPIRTRGSGEVEELVITDSIVQGIRTAGWGPLVETDVKDAARLEKILSLAQDPVSKYLVGLSPALQQNVASPPANSPPDDASFVNALNVLIAGPSLYDLDAFARVPLSYATREWLAQAALSPTASPALNRSLLEDAYPLELADAALAIADGDVSLSRCTILGRVTVHRLQASECILNDLAAVDDAQNGCVRFTAFSKASVLPRQFECVRIQPGAALFTSTDFGQPGYAQLEASADSQISANGKTNASTQTPTILSGAETGSEMGAFCLEQNSIKEHALLLKYQEYMPAALIPVLVYVT